jgi:hypothetical protein
MKRQTLILLFLLTCMLFAREVVGKEWRGIVPLHSTRADVVRLFGGCSDSDGGCKFSVGNEEAYIVFSNGVVVSEYHECARKLPPETVLLIEVKLTTPVNLGALRIDKKKFRVFDPSSPPNIGYKGYIDEKEGLIIKTYKGRVLQLNYIAAGSDVPLSRSYYEDPESMIRVIDELPNLTVYCPDIAPIEGERITISADTVEQPRATFRWEVNIGKIIAGQGTLRIVVDTGGAGGQTLKVAVEMNDGHQHLTMASCEVPVSIRPRD